MLNRLVQNKFIWRRLVMLGAFLIFATLLSGFFALNHSRPGCLQHGCTYWDDVKQTLPLAYAWASGLWAFYAILGFIIFIVETGLKKIPKR
jgi:hypothetical protein